MIEQMLLNFPQTNHEIERNNSISQRIRIKYSNCSKPIRYRHVYHAIFNLSEMHCCSKAHAIKCNVNTLGTNGRKHGQNGGQARFKSTSIISPCDRRPSADGLGAIIFPQTSISRTYNYQSVSFRKQDVWGGLTVNWRSVPRSDLDLATDLARLEWEISVSVASILY